MGKQAPGLDAWHVGTLRRRCLASGNGRMGQVVCASNKSNVSPAYTTLELQQRSGVRHDVSRTVKTGPGSLPLINWQRVVVWEESRSVPVCPTVGKVAYVQGTALPSSSHLPLSIPTTGRVCQCQAALKQLFQ